MSCIRNRVHGNTYYISRFVNRVSVAGDMEGRTMEAEDLFAHVNDSIRGLAEDSAAKTWEFICECPDLTCHVLVTLTLGEFDARRSSSPPAAILAHERNA